MGFLSALISLMRASAAYLELKKERYAHDVVEQSRAKIESLEEELEKARSFGTESGTQYADRLRERLVDEKEHFERLSAKYLETNKGSENSD